MLDALVAAGELTGGATATIRDGACTIATAGFADTARTIPLDEDARFRFASVTKPIVSALALALIEDGVLGADDPIATWLPEAAAPQLLRDPRGPVDDVIPAPEPIRVRHLLDATSGWGFPGDLSWPIVARMIAAVGDGRDRHTLPEPDAWLASLTQAPLLFAPGERWLYDTSYDLLGVLLARAAGQPLPHLLQERLLDPLDMHHTSFTVPDDAVRVEGVAWPTGAPRFPSGSGGLIGTIGDLARFAQMLVADGAPLLSPASVEAMTTNRLTDAQRSEAGLYLAGQGWGYGGSVDIAPQHPWQAPGRYGWVGVTGTSLHVRRDHRSAFVVLTARELGDATFLEQLWTAAKL
jgi:CubicO group peptidase (beta-lactamase class C family)